MARKASIVCNRPGRARHAMTAAYATQFWQRQTNLWREATSPACGRKRQRSGERHDGATHRRLSVRPVRANVWRELTSLTRGPKQQKTRRNPSIRIDPSMNEKSECLRPFGCKDFDSARVGWKDFDSGRVDKNYRCPVWGCSENLEGVLYRKKTVPWCPAHEIRLHSHSPTFVYWNEHDEDARLRNFIVRRDLVNLIARKKAESHRLGSEMSEDTLSGNVFVSLAEAGKLREVTKFLTGKDLRSTPQLYLWGFRIDDPDRKHELYEPLRRVRANLEPCAPRRSVTEPDIMLVAKGELVVCIEAKFGSGNTLADDSEPEEGKKKKKISRKELLDRCLGERTSERTRRIVCAEKIGPVLHSQLFRNIVFASEMAGETDWHVVNLVRGTAARRSDNKHPSHADPTDEVRSYLHPDWQNCFTVEKWERLHAEVISGDRDLTRLDEYLHDKSAHFKRAFEWTRND